MSHLDELISRDPARVLKTTGEILRTWDLSVLVSLVPHIEEIRASTKNLKLGGALYPNSAHVARAITRLEYVRDKRGCLCALYTSDEFADPDREAAAGNVTITREIRVDNYLEGFECACTQCGASYQVNIHSGHFDIFKWVRLVDSDVTPSASS